MARFDELLVSTDFAVGSAYYADRYRGDEHHARIVVMTTPEQGHTTEMIVDTGAPWCVLDPELAEDWGLIARAKYIPQERLILRGNRFTGWLIRAAITLQADYGEDLMVDSTIFVPILQPGERWSYPNFLGLDGFLSRIRFAVDPTENVFYFG